MTQSQQRTRLQDYQTTPTSFPYMHWPSLTLSKATVDNMTHSSLGIQ